MKTILKTISYLGLILTLSPAFFHFYGIIAFQQHKLFTLLGTVLYLATAPFWMNKKEIQS